MGKLKDTTDILQTIKDYIGDSGMVAFEHGFRRPTFKLDGYKYVVTMVSQKVVYGYKYYPASRDRRTCNYPLSFLKHSVLKKLYDTFIKYEEYCKKEA